MNQKIRWSNGLKQGRITSKPFEEKVGGGGWKKLGELSKRSEKRGRKKKEKNRK